VLDSPERAPPQGSVPVLVKRRRAKAVGEGIKHRENHGKTMGKPWENGGYTLWLCQNSY